MRLIYFAVLVAVAGVARGQLAVTFDEPKITGDRAVVTLQLQNLTGEEVRGARAAVFLYDEHGKVVEQAARWIVGGTAGGSRLTAGATNVFNFVVPVKHIRSTNLTAKVVVNRVVLADGSLADVNRTVTVARRRE